MLASTPSQPGELDIRWLDRAHQAARLSEDREILVDFAAVEMICSEDLSELIHLQSTLRKAGRTLILENVEPHLWQIFSVTRIDRLIEVRPAVQGPSGLGS